MLTIASAFLSADLSPLGAELQDLRDATGRSLQWDGDPAVWAGRAPLLFPIVGRLRNDRYRLHGRTYALPKHGFARRSTFAVVAHEAHGATLRLDANEQTRAAYPFEFRLEIAYVIDGATLRVTTTITNRGATPMPASFGLHPAFRWPLPFDAPRAAHRIRFDRDEPAPLRRIDADGFLTPDLHPSPIVGDTLALRDDLFVDDALIFDRLVGRRVRYGAASGPAIDVAFDDFALLGVWTKPGAGFVCIEPWQGIADPVGFDGDLFEKPGIFVVEPDRSRIFTMTITLAREG